MTLRSVTYVRKRKADHSLDIYPLYHELINTHSLTKSRLNPKLYEINEKLKNETC